MKGLLNKYLRIAMFAVLAAALPGLAQTARAQCTPDQTLISATHYPTTLATACVGQPYNETIYITFPDDSVVGGANVIFDYFEIVNNSLPPGLTYACNVPNCKWTPSNTPKSQELLYGCITISGTPTAPFNGQFTIDIEGCGTVIIITQCQTEVIPFNMTILPSPLADFNTQVNQNQVTFNDLSTSSDPIISWLWDFGDGMTSTASNPTHTYAAAGNYAPCLTVGTAGCSKQHCSQLDIVSVSADPQTAFARDANIFPNPATGSVTIDLGQATRPLIGLRSTDGRMVREWQFSKSGTNFREDLDLQGIPGGLYFLDIRTKEGSVVKKLQVQ
jgi:PKD repeat protein